MRFYFHLQNQHERLEDEEGVEAVDAAEAIEAARAEITDLGSTVSSSHLDGWKMIIVDETGALHAELDVGYRT